MNENDCMRIAADAGIQFESSIDIFYNRHLEFDKYESNVEAANQFRVFCSKAIEEAKKKQKSVLGFNWN